MISALAGSGRFHDFGLRVRRDVGRRLGFEGVEAITFNGDDVYVTVETNQGAKMLGYMKPGWSI